MPETPFFIIADTIETSCTGALTLAEGTTTPACECGCENEEDCHGSVEGKRGES
jgi:hypothetical protein